MTIEQYINRVQSVATQMLSDVRNYNFEQRQLFRIGFGSHQSDSEIVAIKAKRIVNSQMEA